MAKESVQWWCGGRNIGLPVFRDGERTRMCPLDIERASSWQRWKAKKHATEEIQSD